MYNQTFTAPSSPASPRFRTSHDGHRERGRPVIVDERPLRRVPSVGAVVSDRPRRSHSIDRNRTRRMSGATWDSPSSSHTSFNSRLRLEEEEIERIRLAEIQRQLRAKDIEAAERSKQAEIERQHHLKDIAAEERRKEAEIERRVQKQLEEQRKAARIRAQDEEIKRRPAVPLAPMPPPPARRRPVVTIVDQADMLPEMMGGLGINDRIKEEQEEAMKARLRERQLPKRRFSVGPGYRRHRVAYDDGMYRWE
ncbi:hypothetical protein B0J14DRAFT_619487 [Halenospora varia]|nr:hypothetical protein B0J14DRAFT_619487 [Halenospora varia]